MEISLRTGIQSKSKVLSLFFISMDIKLLFEINEKKE